MKCPRHVHSRGLYLHAVFLKGGIEGCNRLKGLWVVGYICSPAYATIETNTASLVVTEDRFRLVFF